VSKELFRNTEIDVSKSKNASENASTEVDEAASALMERMLFGAKPQSRSAQDHPRIILGLDCTASMGEYIEARKITLEAATTMANALFAKAGSTGLQVRLAFFRGDDQYSKQPRQLELLTRGTATQRSWRAP
jgi:hypothetical protein